MSVTERIEQLIAPTVEEMGFSIVRVQLSGGDRLQLQVMVERQDGQLMVVDDCAELSRAISAILDVEDPIADAYTLEVARRASIARWCASVTSSGSPVTRRESRRTYPSTAAAAFAAGCWG